MDLTGSLHEAGLVCFFQQLLRERHQARVLHQTASLRHLSSQRLAALLPRHLQGLGERGVALRQRRRQIPDALSQLLPGGHTVHLETSDRGWRQRREESNQILSYFSEKQIQNLAYLYKRF